ncbi:hypothetical protein V9T40_008262 [Parthenolecanium corni]|uniref:Uncharacterized protein n=1 Tax=Parthenolecanium corni TaxID=536013 RepID=A0AAN9TMS7_9HEMI
MKEKRVAKRAKGWAVRREPRTQQPMRTRPAGWGVCGRPPINSCVRRGRRSPAIRRGPRGPCPQSRPPRPYRAVALVAARQCGPRPDTLG